MNSSNLKLIYKSSYCFLSNFYLLAKNKDLISQEGKELYQSLIKRLNLNDKDQLSTFNLPHRELNQLNSLLLLMQTDENCFLIWQRRFDLQSNRTRRLKVRNFLKTLIDFCQVNITSRDGKIA